jgi:hypothetical protein
VGIEPQAKDGVVEYLKPDENVFLNAQAADWLI